MQITVKRTADFQLSGDGARAEWQRAEWQALARVQGSLSYGTRAKVLYSPKGIYFLVDCEDRTLHCTIEKDMGLLFNEDVVEVFLWPFEEQHVYLEYEISPLNYELPIIVPNFKGAFYGWLPWQYEKERACRHATAVSGAPTYTGSTTTARRDPNGRGAKRRERIFTISEISGGSHLNEERNERRG
jgi:hypothetical protein